MEASHTPFIVDRLAFVANCIELSKAQKPYVDEPANGNRKAYIFKHGDAPIMVHTMTVADLKPDDYKKFTENYVAFVTEMTKDEGGKLKLTAVEQINGKDVIHQRMDPGIMFVSARSMIVQQYHVPEAQGHTLILSSKESGELEKKYAAIMGKDVISTLEVNYWNFKPTEDGNGTHVTHVNSSKPNGSIPDMAVNKMTQKQAEAILTVSAMVRARK